MAGTYDGSIKIDTKLDTNALQKGLGDLGGVAKRSMVGVASAIGLASTALAGLAGWAIKTGADFEAGMSDVQAISRATGDEMQQLTDKAMEMGARTKFSASESADAFKFMASAGWNTADMLGGIEGVMNLAAASGEELALTSDIVTGSLTAFGLKASDSAHFADVLAMAANASNTSVKLMGETFEYVAPVAGALGYSIEDMSVAVGLMANSNIKGSQAGTALRATLTRLAKPTKESAQAMSDLGISLTDSSGNIKPFNALMEDMRKGFEKLSPAQKANYAAMLGGQEAMSGLLAIVNASDEAYDSLTEQVNNANGAALKAAAIRQDNLKGYVEQLMGGLETLGIRFYKSVDNPLKLIAKSAADMVEQLSTAFKEGGFEGLVTAIGDVLAQVVTGIADYAPKMVDAAITLIGSLVNGTTDNLDKIINASLEIVGAITDAIINNLDKIIDVAFKIVDALVAGIIDNLPRILASAGTLIDKLLTGLSDGIPELAEKAGELVGALAGGLAGGDKEMQEAGRKLVEALIKGILSMDSAILDIPTKIIEGIKKGINDNMVGFGSWAAQKLVTAMVESVASTVTGGLYKSVGADIIRGITAGMNGGEANLKSAAGQAVQTLLNKLKKDAEIKSPSRVMRDEVGKMLVEGIAVGIEENAYEATDAFDKLMKDLNIQRDTGVIDEAEYYRQLEYLRDNYFEKGSEKWWQYTLEIMNHEKDLVDQQKKDIVKMYGDAVDAAGKSLDEIARKQDAFASKMKGFGKLFEETTTTYHLGEGKEDLVVKNTQLRDLKPDIAALKEYNSSLKAVKDRGASGGLMTEIMDMSIEDGSKFADALLAASDDDFAQYIKDFEEKQKYAVDAAKDAYAEDVAATIDALTQKIKDAGLEIPDGFFENGKSAAENFGTGFMEKLNGVMDQIKVAVSENMAKILPTLSFSGGVPALAGGGTTSYSTTYQFASSGETVGQQLETAKRADAVKTLRGDN